VANGDGATNCGAAVESCCTSLPVTGGTYERTYVNNGSGPSGLADPASVSSFRLDKYEVTVGRFRRFVAAWNGGAGYLPPAGSGKHTHLNGGRGLVNAGPPPDAGATYEPGWLAANDASVAPTDANLSDAQCDPGSSFATWTPSTGANETRPINCINWYEAYAFCIWDGGFLPSEAEWEYAAAGGAMQLEYPWGTTSPGPGTQYQIYECNYPGGTGCASSANIAPVGTASLGAGPWGQLDLLGNLEEFAVDSSAVPYVNPCVDCAHLTPTTQVIARGGAFSDDVSGLLPPDRNSVLYAYRGDGDGFRCARTP
jgi:formylglycine-generating enzyme required for sulfatase activity